MLTTMTSCLCVCVSHSAVSNSLTARAVALQALLSMGSSRQEYWSGLPSPSPGDLPDPGMGPKSPASRAMQAGSSVSERPGKLPYSPEFDCLQSLCSLKAFLHETILPIPVHTGGAPSQLPSHTLLMPNNSTLVIHCAIISLQYTVL